MLRISELTLVAALASTRKGSTIWSDEVALQHWCIDYYNRACPGESQMPWK
jgi:hypothetical protein